MPVAVDLVVLPSGMTPSAFPSPVLVHSPDQQEAALVYLILSEFRLVVIRRSRAVALRRVVSYWWPGW